MVQRPSSRMGKINMVVGIILAAGKGTRLKSRDKNKVILPFLNKPLILYAVELLEELSDEVIVVIGAFHESVRAALQNFSLVFAYQRKRLGTGHGVKVAVTEIQNRKIVPKEALVCYGDHSMFYKRDTIRRLIELHRRNNSMISFVTTEYDYPDRLAWGRIVRDKKGNIIGSVEQKDATEEQRKIKEINPCFYCFDYEFLKNNIGKIEKSPASGEYYLTDMIKIAVQQQEKIEVAIGINKLEELAESQKIYLERK